MYQALIEKIQSTLEDVAAIKAIYAFPATNIGNYPAAIFFPDAFQNTFETTADNFKIYRFRLYIVVSATQKEIPSVFSTVLPKAVDAVVAKFDADWDGGTIDGHRVSCLVNSGTWSMAPVQNGLEATAELTVEFRVLTTV